MDQPFLLADIWLIHDIRSAMLDQLFHIVLDQLSRSAQLSRLNIPHMNRNRWLKFALCQYSVHAKICRWHRPSAVL